MIDYVIFGVVDNAVMIAGAFTGVEVEKYLPKRFKMGLLMPIVGAGIGNMTSDFLGGVFAMNAPLAIGSALGCFLALALIPLFNLKFKLGA